MSFFVSFIDDVVYGYRLKVHLVDVQVEQNSETIECYSMKGHTTAGMVFRAVFLLVCSEGAMTNDWHHASLK